MSRIQWYLRADNGQAGWANRRRQRGERGASLLVVAMLLLLLSVSIMPLLIQASVVGRASYSAARSQQRLRLVDTAMNQTISQLRLTREASGTACFGATEWDPVDHPGVYEFPPISGSLPGVDDEGLGAQNAGGSADVIVRCQAVSPTSVTQQSREIDLQAVLTIAGGDWNDSPIGLARVKYIDMNGAREAPGMEMIVCDWRLGKFPAGFSGLAECPA
jgi:hypothetical protein